MERSPDSVRLVVEEEKHGNSASIQASCFLGGAMPVGVSMACGKGRMAHNSRFCHPGRCQHPRFSTLLPWEHTPRAEAFPGCYFRRCCTS